MRAHELAVGAVPCLALRVTYVGELGWELYCPAEFGLSLWDTLWEAGSAHGLVAGGYKAIDSLRLEKGYRVWGADVTPEETPFEAGLGFAVKLDKGDVRRPRRAAAARRSRRALCCLTLDDPRAVALGSEPVRVGDELVGRVTSGGYGYTVGARSPTRISRPNTPRPVRESRSRSSATGSRGVVAAEPLFDPPGRPDPRIGRAGSPYPAGGRSAANGSVISSGAAEAEVLAGRPPARPEARRSPVGSSTPRRRRTRFRFVAETS